MSHKTGRRKVQPTEFKLTREVMGETMTFHSLVPIDEERMKEMFRDAGMDVLERWLGEGVREVKCLHCGQVVSVEYVIALGHCTTDGCDGGAEDMQKQ